MSDPSVDPAAEDVTPAVPVPYACPHCGREVDVAPADAAQEVACPTCGVAFVVPARDGTTDLPDEAAEREAAMARRESELSAIRIRQLSSARRAAYRARSWCVIGAGVCAVAAGQLVANTVGRTRGLGWDRQSFGYVVFALLATWAAMWFVRKAVAFTREARQSRLTEPTAPPDFSTLGDGSQQWKELENVR